MWGRGIWAAAVVIVVRGDVAGRGVQPDGGVFGVDAGELGALHGLLKPGGCGTDEAGVKRRAEWFVVGAVAVACCVGVSLWGSLGWWFVAGDYPGPPCNGCDSAGPPLAFLGGCPGARRTLM